VQDCLRESERYELASPTITALFQTALKTGGRVRRETALGRSLVSVASVAVDLAQRILSPLAQQSIAILGAGATGRLLAKILCGVGVERLTLLNRTEAHAAEVAEAVGAEARPLADLPVVLQEANLVFGAISGEETLVDADSLAGRDTPLVIIDLGVPRCVDESVQQVSGVRLFDIDTLQAEVDASLTLRRAEVPQAESIVEEEVDAFWSRMQKLTVEPLIRDLRIRAETIRQEELERVLDSMNGLSAEDVVQLRYFSRALVNKLLHEPTTRVRGRAGHSGTGQEADLVKDLFAL